MEHKIKKNTKKAFQWIVGILKKHKIPFQITGGLAAQAYGSKRPLNDIDIDILKDRFNEILTEVKNYIIYGPARYVDERWDLKLMTLEHQGQKIDISGAYQTKICDIRTKKWCQYPVDFTKNEKRKIFGLLVPVISKNDLVEYKSILGRKEDKQDIKAI